MGEYVQEIHQRVAAVEPPNMTPRIPPSIANDLKHWKASEYHSFLLFYGAIALWDFLP